jgi:hypothetical protein
MAHCLQLSEYMSQHSIYNYQTESNIIYTILNPSKFLGQFIVVRHDTSDYNISMTVEVFGNRMHDDVYTKTYRVLNIKHI